MRFLFKRTSLFVFCYLILIVIYDTQCRSFYEVLRVPKQASFAEIKDAYKHLAKKWHLDLNKNDNVSKQNLFLLNEAYKTLSDPHMRSMYDLFGKGSSELDHFLTGDHLIEGESFHLPISKHPIMIQLPLANNRLYDSQIKLKSQQQAQLLFVSNSEQEQDWIEWANKISHNGIKCYFMHSFEEKLLLRRLRYPSSHDTCMGVVMEGMVTWSCPIPSTYNDVTTFVSHTFPSQLCPVLSNGTYEFFLETSRHTRNHVSMILFSDLSLTPPLPFLASLFATKKHISGAFVFKNVDTKSMFQEQNLPNQTTTLLVFKENPHTPVLKFSLPQINTHHYHSILKAHSTLHTPRLSCPHLFDLLCPLNTYKNQKSLCVILLMSADDGRFNDFHNSFNLYSQDYPHKDRVKFCYASFTSQKSFVKLLMWDKTSYNQTSDSLSTVILWRKDTETTLSFEVLEGGWARGGSALARSRRRLAQSLDWLLNHPNSLPNVVEMRVPLVDEHLPKIYVRIGYRFLKWFEIVVDFFLGIEDSTYIMVIKSTLFMLGAGAIIGYLHMREMRQLHEQEALKGGGVVKENVNKKPPKPERPVIQIYMMHPSNYNDILLKSPSEIRLILLLVDGQSKNTLANYFGSFLTPYSRSKAFRFACVDLDTYFQWYRELLELTMKQSENYQKLKRSFNNINVKNCIGTVLAINGIKKYYYMYHISYYKRFTASQMKRKTSDDEDSDDDDDDIDDDGSPAFEELSIGMSNLKRRKPTNTDNHTDSHTDNHAQKEEDKLLECDLLRGLGRWLERMVQGDFKKFRISHWPPTMQ